MTDQSATSDQSDLFTPRAPAHGGASVPASLPPTDHFTRQRTALTLYLETSGDTWRTREDITRALGWSERLLRDVAETFGPDIVRSQAGFKLTHKLSREDILLAKQASDSSLSQGKKMIKYALALRKKIHALIGCLIFLAVSGADNPVCPPSFAGPIAQVELTWEPDAAASSQNVTNYLVFWGLESGHYSRIMAAGNTNSAIVTNNITPGLEYFFAVSAQALDGRVSNFSNEVELTGVPSGPPPCPPILHDQTIAELTWPGTVWMAVGGIWGVFSNALATVAVPWTPATGTLTQFRVDVPARGAQIKVRRVSR